MDLGNLEQGYLEFGDQRQDRTADAGLFRAVISNTWNYLHAVQGRLNTPKYVENGAIAGEDHGWGFPLETSVRAHCYLSVVSVGC